MTSFRDRAEKCLRWVAPKLEAQPTMAPQMLVAIGRWLSEPEQIVIRCSEITPEVETLLIGAASEIFAELGTCSYH